jgi:hypothetical protein
MPEPKSCRDAYIKGRWYGLSLANAFARAVRVGPKSSLSVNHGAVEPSNRDIQNAGASELNSAYRLNLIDSI